MSDLRKPLGFIDASAIMTVCDFGERKNADHCIEVLTRERNWYFWASDAADETTWIAAIEEAKQAGKAPRARKSGHEKKKSGVFQALR